MKHCRSFALRALQSSTALSLVIFSYTASAQVQPQQLPSVEINLAILEKLANSEVFNVVSENEIAQINETIAKAEAEAITADETANEALKTTIADKPKLDDLVPYELDQNNAKQSVTASTVTSVDNSAPVEIAPLEVLPVESSVPLDAVTVTEVIKDSEIKEITQSDAVIITKPATDEEIKKSKEIIEEKKIKKRSLFSLFSRKKDNKQETAEVQQPESLEVKELNDKLVESEQIASAIPTPKTDVIASSDLPDKENGDDNTKIAKVSTKTKIKDSVVVSPFNAIDQVELIELQDTKPVDVELVSKPIDLSKDEQELASIGEKDAVIEKFIEAEASSEVIKPIESDATNSSTTEQTVSKEVSDREERKKSWFSSLKNILKKPNNDTKELTKTTETKEKDSNNNLHVVDITPLDSIKSDGDKTSKNEDIPIGDIEPVQIILPNRIDDEVVSDNIPLPVLKETPPDTKVVATKSKKETVKPTIDKSLEKMNKPIEVAKVVGNIKKVEVKDKQAKKVAAIPVKEPAIQKVKVLPTKLQKPKAPITPKNVILPNEVKPVKESKKEVAIDFNVHKTSESDTNDSNAPVNIIDFANTNNNVATKSKLIKPTPLPEKQKVLTAVEDIKAKTAEATISNQEKATQALPNGALLALDFMNDSTIVSEENRERLSKLAGDILRDNNKKIKIISYAKSSDGHPSSSRRISLQRAIAIRSHLINAGFPSVRINVQAVGDKARSAGELANSSYLYLIQN